MLSSLFVLLTAAAPVELTVVQSTPARIAPVAKRGAAKHQAYVEARPKRTVSTAYVDAQGKLHVQCQHGPIKPQVVEPTR